jgi:hypothetical protein
VLNSVVGKVFLHPITRTEYGLIRVPSRPTTFSTLDGISFDILAEDGCGNCFTTSLDGAVWFWDHETDELVRLANSVPEFISNCVAPQPVELRPDQVTSVWIDPAFAKSIGQEVPKDGWVKKPSTKK